MNRCLLKLHNWVKYDFNKKDGTHYTTLISHGFVSQVHETDTFLFLTIGHRIDPVFLCYFFAVSVAPPDQHFNPCKTVSRLPSFQNIPTYISSHTQTHSQARCSKLWFCLLAVFVVFFQSSLIVSRCVSFSLLLSVHLPAFMFFLSPSLNASFFASPHFDIQSILSPGYY